MVFSYYLGQVSVSCLIYHSNLTIESTTHQTNCVMNPKEESLRESELGIELFRR